MHKYFWIVGLSAIAASAAPVTYNKDVLPILEKSCQGCHRPGQVATMSFLTYQSTRPWAKAMKVAVLTRKMPPWFQLGYDLGQPVHVPKGTKLVVSAHYDNSVNKKFNPDPNKTVYYGDMTWEEMMFPFFSVVVDQGADIGHLIRIIRGRQSDGA